jgi:DNA repair exonuclease SbcCD ATPase subunit
LEISAYNEKIEDQIQQLHKTMTSWRRLWKKVKKGIVVLEIVKEEATRANEELRDVQKKLFFLLNMIQKNRSDHLKLGLQMNSVKEKYQKVQSAYDKIVDWKDVYDNPPNILPVYTTKQRIKYQVLLNTGKSILNDIKTTQEIVEKSCKILWRTSDNLLEQFGMETLEI